MADDQSPNLETEAGDEHRLHLVILEYWQSILAGRSFPKLTDMSPDMAAEIRDVSFLINFLPGTGEAALRFVGRRLEEEHGGDEELHGKTVTNLAHYSIINRLATHFHEVVKERAPLGFEAEYDRPQGFSSAYRGILLPFSDNGTDIHFILGVIGWIDRIPAGDDIRADVLAEDADQGKRQEMLFAALEDGRSEARNIVHTDASARQQLYHALSKALGLFEAAQRAPDAYRKLLREKGLRVQARAPFTPALKLIFGIDHDKTRITEYAAALAFAVSRGENAQSLAAFLAGQPGGIKGCVWAERQARKRLKGDVAQKRMDGLRARMLNRRPLAAVHLKDFKMDQSGDEDFVLLMARKSRQPGLLEILDILPEPQNVIEAALRKVARGAPGQGTSKE